MGESNNITMNTFNINGIIVKHKSDNSTIDVQYLIVNGWPLVISIIMVILICWHAESKK